MSLRRFFHRLRQDRERAEEMRAHVDLAVQHYIDQGLSPADARRRATLRFGNMRAHREGVDDMNRLPILDVLGRDLRYALRILRRTPAFTLTAIGTLAVVIGANTAVFSVADHVLLRPLPFPEPSRLALTAVNVQSPKGNSTDAWVDGRMWEAIRDRVKSADRAVFVSGSGGVNFNLGSAAAFVKQQRVGAGFFRVLGVAPLHGREFAPEEDQPSGPKVAMLSYRLWRDAFSSDPDVTSTTIMLRGEAYRIVGVMPEGFVGTDPADVWTPVRASTKGEGSGTNYQVVTRLNPGASWDQLNAELASFSTPDLFASVMNPTSIDPAKGVRVWLGSQPMQSALVEAEREPILMLSAAVAVVLIIACVNIASLLLARGGARRKELATRMALGSSRAAVIRQLMVESLVIAALGGVAGVVLGVIGLEGLKALAGKTFTDWQHVSVDGRVLAMTAGLSLVTSLAFGLVPAWQASRIDVQRGLADGGSRSIAGGSRHWLRRTLVVAEVALGCVLLICAGLLIHTFAKLSRLEPGFNPNGITTASVSLQDARYTTAARINHLIDDSLAQLAASPGVESAAVSLELPYTRLLNLGTRFVDEKDGHVANVSYVTSGFRATFDIPLKAGRDLTPADRAGAAPVVLVNEAFVRIYSKDHDVIGRHVLMSNASREIVGVIGDVQQKAGFFADGMVRGPVTQAPAVFAPASQMDDSFFTLVHQWFRPVWSVRAASPDAGRLLQAAIGSVDPSLPAAEVETMAAVRAAALAEQRLMMTLVAVIAGAALLLAAMGLYGLIAHSVSERTREFGIRLALGATAGQTIRDVASSGVTLALIGAAIGGGLSILAVRMVRSLLWGVEPSDPTTYVSVLGFLLIVALVSSLLPALRLLRLDPAKTLRD
jgi:predicted permease